MVVCCVFIFSSANATTHTYPLLSEISVDRFSEILELGAVLARHVRVASPEKCRARGLLRVRVRVRVRVSTCPTIGIVLGFDFDRSVKLTRIGSLSGEPEVGQPRKSTRILRCFRGRWSVCRLTEKLFVMVVCWCFKFEQALVT